MEHYCPSHPSLPRTPRSTNGFLPPALLLCLQRSDSSAARIFATKSAASAAHGGRCTASIFRPSCADRRRPSATPVGTGRAATRPERAQGRRRRRLTLSSLCGRAEGERSSAARRGAKAIGRIRFCLAHAQVQREEVGQESARRGEELLRCGRSAGDCAVWSNDAAIATARRSKTTVPMLQVAACWLLHASRALQHCPSHAASLVSLLWPCRNELFVVGRIVLDALPRLLHR